MNEVEMSRTTIDWRRYFATPRRRRSAPGSATEFARD